LREHVRVNRLLHARLRRIGLIVHPTRAIDGALAATRDWAASRGVEIFQPAVAGQERSVADPGDLGSCDLVLAVGGDGTTLAALHAAAPLDRPVLGVACGSLGALTAVTADELVDALERVATGDWTPRRLPGIAIDYDEGARRVAVNDVVAARRGAGQVIVAIHVDGELYVRFAGDGVIVATPLGSTAYTMAAGGPVLAPDSDGLVLTPVAPHGGCCPPLVTGPGSIVAVDVEPGFGGARMEIDGQTIDDEPRRLIVSRVADHATLIGLGDEPPLFARLRHRRILMDSPRVLARDDRAATGR
jgi:NAD+ kinase